jgi:hypothetical protein
MLGERFGPTRYVGMALILLGGLSSWRTPPRLAIHAAQVRPSELVVGGVQVGDEVVELVIGQPGVK